jgi:hypothetical protein
VQRTANVSANAPVKLTVDIGSATGIAPTFENALSRNSGDIRNGNEIKNPVRREYASSLPVRPRSSPPDGRGRNLSEGEMKPLWQHFAEMSPEQLAAAEADMIARLEAGGMTDQDLRDWINAKWQAAEFNEWQRNEADRADTLEAEVRRIKSLVGLRIVKT